MVVASWINLQYYGSTVNNRAFGAGNKVLHNVVGGLGVLDLDIGSAKYDLLLNLLDGEGGVQGTLEHSADLFEADTVERWLDRFHRILQGAATRPDDRLSAILATAQPAIPIRRSARWNRS